MNVREAVSFTIDSLRANKMRAGLTMLGMVIGTASIILVVTIALAGRDYILQQIQGVGSNLIYLYYEAGGTVSGARSLSDDLTLNDLEAIRSLPSVTTATAILQNHDRIMVGGEEREVNVIGTTPEYRRVRNLKILSGRFFDEIDDRSFNKVCLLTEGLARKLFASLDVRGRSVKFFQVRFAVIGVFKEGVETFGTSEVSAYSALIPMSVMSHFNTTDKVDLIYVSARSSALVPVATEQIRRLLAERHRSGSFYRVENLSEILWHDLAHHQWHWNHEHHAGDGHGTDQRNRHQNGDRGSPQGDPVSVPGGIDLHGCSWRTCGHPTRGSRTAGGEILHGIRYPDLQSLDNSCFFALRDCGRDIWSHTRESRCEAEPNGGAAL